MLDDDNYRKRLLPSSANNRGEKNGSLTDEVSNEKSITINRIHDVTIVTTLDRITDKATTETFIGDSPYGK
jgi:hypothetical protein